MLNDISLAALANSQSSPRTHSSKKSTQNNNHNQSLLTPDKVHSKNSNSNNNSSHHISSSKSHKNFPHQQQQHQQQSHANHSNNNLKNQHHVNKQQKYNEQDINSNKNQGNFLLSHCLGMRVNILKLDDMVKISVGQIIRLKCFGPLKTCLDFTAFFRFKKLNFSKFLDCDFLLKLKM